VSLIAKTIRGNLTDEKKLLVANIEKVGETGNPVRWLDWFDYGKNVDLKGREIPWGDTTRLVNFIGQGRILLNLGVVSIDLGDYFVWWLRQARCPPTA
jgi:hypothetical protein